MRLSIINIVALVLILSSASVLAAKTKSNSTSLAKDRNVLFLLPLSYGEYASEPKKLVLKGMKRYGWSIASETETSVQAHLLHKGEDMSVNITFVDGVLTLAPVAPAKKRSSYSENNVYNWMANLRKGVAKEFHLRAITDATPEEEMKKKKAWSEL